MLPARLWLGPGPDRPLPVSVPPEQRLWMGGANPPGSRWVPHGRFRGHGFTEAPLPQRLGIATLSRRVSSSPRRSHRDKPNAPPLLS